MLSGLEISKQLMTQYKDKVQDNDADNSIKGTSSGLKVLDMNIGTIGGGYPVGRITEIIGEPGSGKSLLTLLAGAQAQKNGGIFIYIDAERSWNPTRAAELGIDVKNTPILLPESQEELYKMVYDAIKLVRQKEKEIPFIISIDSFAALLEDEEEYTSEEVGVSGMGGLARLNSHEMKKLSTLVEKSKTTLLVINQLREKIGVSYGDNRTTAGGRALRYYASLRMEVKCTEKMKDPKGEVIGMEGIVFITKNRFSPPFKKVPIRLFFDERGLDTNAGFFTTLICRGLLTVTQTKDGKDRKGYYSLKGFTHAITENNFNKFFEEDLSFRKVVEEIFQDEAV